MLDVNVIEYFIVSFSRGMSQTEDGQYILLLAYVEFGIK